MNTTDSALTDIQNEIVELRRQLAEAQAERDAAQAGRDEALDQQTATAEVLGVINSSPGDLKPVFEAMLESALRLCEAAFGQLWTYDGDCFDMVAARGVPTEFSELMRGPQRFNPRTAHGRMVAGERIVHIADLAAEELYRSGDPGRRATVDIAGARSLL